MTPGKDRLINQISSSTGFPKKAAGQLLESFLELMKSTLQSGEPIMISGFGKFQVKDKNNQRGRNPQSGNALILDARRIVTFKCSEGLKKRMNAHED